jgi:hypothetical protein
MKMTKSLIPAAIIIISCLTWLSCSKKGGTDDGSWTLSYGDSILYLKPAASDYIVSPVNPRTGTYSAFPEGIEIDDKTGAINISRSETGLRYRINYKSPNGTETSTTVVLSGINFADRFYRLSQNDTIAMPVYNANPARSLPVNGSVFDEGGTAGISGCDIKTVNGQINLAQSVRNGLFGSNPTNDDRKDVEIVYRLNDNSNKAVNKIKVRLYYYTSMASVAPDLLQTLQDRESGGVFLRGATASSTKQAARPRPPCVIIIAN